MALGRRHVTLRGAIVGSAVGLAAMSPGQAAAPPTRSVIEQAGVQIEVIAREQGPALLPGQPAAVADAMIAHLKAL
jgi:ethanolamine utilization microcompartment shell protein EutS